MNKFLKRISFLYLIIIGLASSCEEETSINVPSDGLLAYYPFNGNSNDASGNERHGISSDITYIPDRNGNLNSAILFSGNGFIKVEDIGEMDSSFTIAFWYSTVQSGTILSTDNIFLATDKTNNQLLTAWACSIGTYTPAGNPAYFDNSWHHVAVAHDGVNSRIITVFDGVVIHDRPNSGYYVGNNNEFFIGRVSQQSVLGYTFIPEYFTGSIDDVCFYNRALNSSDIEQLFK
jgi:hypothetical protein